VGDSTEEAKLFANLLLKGADKEKVEVLDADSTEAEAIKLFSNTFLTKRVS